MKTFLRLTVFASLILAMWSSGFNSAFAQTENEVSCGDTVADVEFKNPSDKHEYYIQLKARGFLEVITEGVGDQLTINTSIYSSSGVQIGSNGWWYPKKTSAKTGELSQTARYKVVAHAGNTGGLYSISFICSGMTPDTKPTASPKKANEPVAQSQATALPSVAFSGYGVPAQSSTDFTNVESATLSSGEPIKDAIDSKATTPTLYTFDGKAKQTLDLSFTRTSGNVNMGIAVVGPDNKTLFQVSIIASDAFNTKLVLPADGKYTIGVYRVELNPPAKPKATSFELTATVK